MSEFALPLFRLTKDGVSWCWDSSCEESYQQLCKSFAKEPVVKYRRGADNLAADHLSRFPTNVYDVVNDDIYSVQRKELEDYSGGFLEISERITY